MRIFISAGEPSGDLHAANLARAILARRPDTEIVGFGGEHLKATGATLLYPLTELAVMWFGRVLLNLRKFFKLADQADAYFRDEKPDAVVLIDYPGFHWALAKRAKARGIPVIYYVPPQLWAWAGWRVKKVQKWVDHVLCSLPFEPQWYHERGVPGATFVGHPYFDELADRPLDHEFLGEQSMREAPVVVLLPGSRTQELERNFPAMLRAASKVLARRKNVRFVVACLHEKHRSLAREMLRQSGLLIPSLEIHCGRTAELIRMADLAWAVSGSVGLELMNEALPTVVVYTIKPFDLMVARRFMTTKFISLVNLLADAEVMPEYLTDRDVSSEMAEHALLWLNDPAERAKASQCLASLRNRVAVPGASERAADRVIGVIEGRSATLRGPHRPPESRPARRDEDGSAPGMSLTSS
ncbi:MAG: lipid-A-disaccharide synthase [Planctomycetota bacterium]|nr:lipid-A-disaccharide synthase [Planctomycetota bacterium]